MTSTYRESPTSGALEELIRAEHPSSGTEDDDDNHDDEHEGENEASQRETDENTEAPEEFEIDDEDAAG
ncbi:MAG: hypothetical protein ACP5P4_16815 [Steroidobacteraceae bacterium]